MAPCRWLLWLLPLVLAGCGADGDPIPPDGAVAPVRDGGITLVDQIGEL